jgi:D-alanyl-D-alanine carboxypeptidase-like protein
VLRLVAAVVALAVAPSATAGNGFHSSIKPVPASVVKEMKAHGFLHSNCPVGVSSLRVLTVTTRGFDKRSHTSQAVVNAGAAPKLAAVFHQLYRLHFPIRHMQLRQMYGPASAIPKDNDVSGAFDCRQAVPSPCVGGNGTGSWSMHAFGLAIDINPLENPYVGCGQSRDPATKPFFNRSRHRPGMVTGRVVRAFGSVGWGWGGSWAGNTKDYMHFSSSGH